MPCDGRDWSFSWVWTWHEPMEKHVLSLVSWRRKVYKLDERRPLWLLHHLSTQSSKHTTALSCPTVCSNLKDGTTVSWLPVQNHSTYHHVLEIDWSTGYTSWECTQTTPMTSASGDSAARQRRIKASHRNASLSFLITDLWVVHTEKLRSKRIMLSSLFSKRYGISDMPSERNMCPLSLLA